MHRLYRVLGFWVCLVTRWKDLVKQQRAYKALLSDGQNDPSGKLNVQF